MHFDDRSYALARRAGRVPRAGAEWTLPTTYQPQEGAAAMTTLVIEDEATEVEQDAPVAPATAHVEEDGVDWCAWWSAYAATLE